MSSNALALITDEIYGTRDSFMAVLSDKSLNFEKEAGFAIQIIGSGDYILSVASKNRQSVVNAVTNIAAIGISLNPAKKQAYLVPRRPNAGSDAAICLDISYMGLIDLAVESGSIKWAQAQIVRKNDKFIRGRMDQLPVHEFEEFAPADDRGDIVGVYVVVKTADGDYLTHTMDIGKVNDIRDRSEAWKSYVAKKIKSCPWISDTEEMIKKTCVKQGYKYWPKTERLNAAIHYLNTDGGEGLRDINPPPETGRIDVKPVIAAALQTTTDVDALAFWKANNAQFAKQPGDHQKLKETIANHRAALRAKDSARTVDMETLASTEKKTAPSIQPQHESLIADLEAEAQNGTEAFDAMWASLSPETLDDIADHLPRLQELAARKK